MFHSGEEQNRIVEHLDELQHSSGSTTATTLDAANSTNTFELGHITASDFDSIGFDSDCDFGRRNSWATCPSTYNTGGERQCFSTFAPEDKWPI
ncbi:unnamed protein product [Adineta ricciae]|uniref:Uncharacterized protein n=1 Tax=Adineta ricciae TaxID=249248 RepID=A0A813UUD4_ADIRI|nr:unnamed protein product [Adineta ricciae]CAF1009127.1 unnamed protein product [Adineta ricciae]